MIKRLPPNQPKCSYLHHDILWDEDTFWQRRQLNLASWLMLSCRLFFCSHKFSIYFFIFLNNKQISHDVFSFGWCFHFKICSVSSEYSFLFQSWKPSLKMFYFLFFVFVFLFEGIFTFQFSSLTVPIYKLLACLLYRNFPLLYFSFLYHCFYCYIFIF